MRGLVALLVLVACSSDPKPDDMPSAEGGAGGEPAEVPAGAPSAGAVNGGSAGRGGSGGTAGSSSAGSSTGGGGSAGTSTGGAGPQCTEVPDTEKTCDGCDIRFMRCGERAHWETETGKRYECRDASTVPPDCVDALAQAKVWAATCCPAVDEMCGDVGDPFEYGPLPCKGVQAFECTYSDGRPVVKGYRVGSDSYECPSLTSCTALQTRCGY